MSPLGSCHRRGSKGIAPPEQGRGSERRSGIEDLGDAIHDGAQTRPAGVPQSLVAEAGQHDQQAQREEDVENLFDRDGVAEPRKIYSTSASPWLFDAPKE